MGSLYISEIALLLDGVHDKGDFQAIPSGKEAKSLPIVE
jgi:hypothetical protein